jgi:hypothetical protein
MHYMRQRRTGETGEVEPRKFPNVEGACCVIPDCEKKAAKFGRLCSYHRHRQTAHHDVWWKNKLLGGETVHS